MTARRTRPLLLVTLAAFALRVIPLEAQSLWRDEVDALCFAFEFPRALAEQLAPVAPDAAAPPCACPSAVPAAAGTGGASTLSGLLGVAGEVIRHNGPLYYFLLRGWITVGGTSVTALRFLSAWLGSLAVPLTYILGRRLLGRPSGLLAALLTAASPYLTWYGQEAKMYALVTMLALLAVYGLRRAAEGGSGRWWAVQVAATSAALYTHVWSALLIPVQVLLFLTWWPHSRRHWRGGLLSLALLVLPYLPLAAWEVNRVLVVRETGFPHYTLGQMVAALGSAWSTGLTGWGGLAGTVACVAAALLGLGAALYGAPDRRERWTALGLVGWIVLPVATVWVISLWQPLFTDRYLIWTVPPFLLLAGNGLAFLGRYRGWAMVPLLTAVLLVFGANLWLQTTVPLKSDFRAAAAFVEEAYEEGDLLIFQIPHARYTFDYYFTPSDYASAEGLYTNHRLPDGGYQVSAETAGAHMAGLTWGHDRVWLVSTEADMWDDRRLVEQWLTATSTLAAEGHFAWVDVYLFQVIHPQ